MSTEDKKFPFGVIEGGKKGPVEKRDKRLSKIDDDIAHSGAMSAAEKLALVVRMKDEKMLDVRSAVQKFNGRFLTDDQAKFIVDRTSGIAWGDKRVMDELRSAFPDLTGYFSLLAKGVEEMEAEHADSNERAIVPEDYSYIQMTIHGDGKKVNLQYTPKTAQLSLGKGVSLQGKTYRIQGSGQDMINGIKVRTFLLTTPEFFAENARIAHQKEPFFSVEPVDDFILVDVKK